MASDHENNDVKIVDTEFRVYMHCDACEKRVAKVISKFKGVERFTTDMRNHRVVVTGEINPEKLMKKLKKKTGKTIELVPPAVEVEEDSKDTSRDDSKHLDLNFCEHWRENELLTMFSDENAHACSIM